MNNPVTSNILAAKAELVDKDLWQRFNVNVTEMIITKTGRRIFPLLKTQFSDLDPDQNYCVLLEMQPVSPYRYKYTPESGWVSCGLEDTPHPGVYIHPDSPSLGRHWMSQSVNFEKCKLTNNSQLSQHSLTLSSMHKYIPKIILVQTDNVQHIHWSPSKTFSFKETEFIAVTAYQNNLITALKIDHNPFAKGFRENGKSRCRKRALEMEIESKRLSSPRRSISSSPLSNSGDTCSQDHNHCYNARTPSFDRRNSESELSRTYYPIPLNRSMEYRTDPYGYYSNQLIMLKPYFESALSIHEDKEKEKKTDDKAVKFTDFSIKTIIG